MTFTINLKEHLEEKSHPETFKFFYGEQFDGATARREMMNTMKTICQSLEAINPLRRWPERQHDIKLKKALSKAIQNTFKTNRAI